MVFGDYSDIPFHHDGWKLSRYYEDALSQIKILERQNKTHLRQVRFWQEMLSEQHIKENESQFKQSLFDTGEQINCQPFRNSTIATGCLNFGDLITFEADWKVPEKKVLAGHGTRR